MKRQRSIEIRRLVLVGLWLAFSAQLAAGEDWPALLGPTADGKSSEKMLLDWPEHGPDVLWFKKVGEGYSAPSIAGGKVFVFDRVGDEARLYALDPADGSEKWRSTYTSTYEDLYRYSGGPRCSPV